MVKVRKYRRRGVATGEWEVDVRVELASGAVYRERKLYRESSFKAEARAWGESREHEVRAHERRELDLDQIHRAIRGEVIVSPAEKPPTLAEFAPRFIEYATANRQKASTVYAKESIPRVHLVPALGKKRLDEVTDVDVQALKVVLSAYAPKTVNNVLATLSKLLRVAKRLKVIAALPVENFDPGRAALLHVRGVRRARRRRRATRPAHRRRRSPGRRRRPPRRRGDGRDGPRPDRCEPGEPAHHGRAAGVARQVWRGVVGTPKSGSGAPSR